ncbi:hypothetical protein BH23CHL8_BH23CHL8_16150 [soil metagenome]
MAPLAGRLYVGTSGFAYPAWAPAFYPRRLDGPGMLASYAERLTAVELNTTFYRRPSPAAVGGWLAATPEDFRFCPRAQRGTALRALRSADPGAAVGWLLDSLAPFSTRLGCVLLSVPSFIPRDDRALAGLLSAWPVSVSLALELAHPSWTDDAVHGLLREHGTALVATDRDDAPEPDLRRSGPRLYLRLRRSRYSDAALERWAQRLEPFLEAGMDAFVFFRHDTDGTSALRAEALAAHHGQAERGE